MKQLEQNSTGLIMGDPSAIPAVSKEVFTALHSRLVSEVLPGDIFYPLKNAIHKSYQDTGFKLEGSKEQIQEKLAYMINEVRKHVEAKHPAIRVDELQIAIERGIRKQYGDYMGLSVISFCLFIDGYMKDEDMSRKKALIEKNKIKDEVIPPTNNEIFDMAKGNALKSLQDVKLGRDITLSGSAVYDWLSKIGLLLFSAREKKEFFEEARLDLVNEYGFKNINEADRFKRIDNKMIIDSLNSEAPVSEIIYKKVLNRAKCLTLKAFLEGVIMEEINLDVLIESKRNDSLLMEEESNLT